MNDTSEVRAMLIESATRLFADHVDSRLLDAAKRDGWSPELWRIVEAAQLPLVSIAEEAGGAGGSLSDLAAVLRIAGRFAAPIPLAETAIAGWMLASCRLPIESGPLAFGPVHGETVVARQHGTQWSLSGSLRRVPWARIAQRLVVLVSGPAGIMVACVDPKQCRVSPGSNLALEPRDDVVLDDVVVAGNLVAPAGPGVDHAALRLRGALARSLLMAGALERALELAVRYSTERTQFGRKIGQFQAIQQELARFAGEVAAAVAAALSAAGALERGEDPLLAVASAKIRTAQAAHEGALIAHQVHGAIGVTDEYALHHSTLRLWSWRDEFGNEATWAAELGRALAAAGADQLWPMLTQEQTA
ncbi:MAG: acyl-CoA/acyl-ACP dehydrogenase [Betaproteobacteria bacterium]|nr:acyl-CoA/acyl-ACP dehydrogenase [Betaproteobacteria bacterium]